MHAPTRQLRCIAALLGIVLCAFPFAWAIILPLKRISTRVAAVASGELAGSVQVPNHDEFGTLSANINTMSAQLDKLYGDVRLASQNLQAVVDNAMDGILTLDADNNISAFNPAAQRASAAIQPQPVHSCEPQLVKSRPAWKQRWYVPDAEDKYKFCPRFIQRINHL